MTDYWPSKLRIAPYNMYDEKWRGAPKHISLKWILNICYGYFSLCCMLVSNKVLICKGNSWQQTYIPCILLSWIFNHLQFTHRFPSYLTKEKETRVYSPRLMFFRKSNKLISQWKCLSVDAPPATRVTKYLRPKVLLPWWINHKYMLYQQILCPNIKPFSRERVNRRTHTQTDRTDSIT